MKNLLKHIAAFIKEDKKIINLVFFTCHYEKEPTLEWHKYAAAVVLCFLTLIGGFGLYYTYQSYNLSVKLSYYNFLSDTNNNKYALKKALEELPQEETVEGLLVGGKRDIYFEKLHLSGKILGSSFIGVSVNDATFSELEYGMSFIKSNWTVRNENSDGNVSLIDSRLEFTTLIDSEVTVYSFDETLTVRQCIDSDLDLFAFDKKQREKKNKSLKMYSDSRGASNGHMLHRTANINTQVDSILDPFGIIPPAKPGNTLYVYEGDNCGVSVKNDFANLSFEKHDNSAIKISESDYYEGGYGPGEVWINSSNNINLELNSKKTVYVRITDSTVKFEPEPYNELHENIIIESEDIESKSPTDISFSGKTISNVHLSMSNLNSICFDHLEIDNLYLVLVNKVDCDALNNIQGKENIVFGPNANCMFGSEMDLGTYLDNFPLHGKSISSYMERHDLKPNVIL